MASFYCTANDTVYGDFFESHKLEDYKGIYFFNFCLFLVRVWVVVFLLVVFLEIVM